MRARPSQAWMLLAGFAGGLAWPTWGLATSLAVSPSVQEIVVRPGETNSYRMRVEGPREEAIPVRFYAWDYWYDETWRRIVGPPGTTPRSAAGWLEIVPATVEVGAENSADVLVSVSAPPEAVGAYYAIVFAQAEYSEPVTGVPTAVAVARVGSVLVVHVDGTLEHGLRLVDTRFSPPTSTSAATITLTVENTGNVDVRPEFRGLVQTTDGQALGRLSAQFDHRVLPGERGSLVMQWTVPMEPGAYELVGSLLYGVDRTIPFAQPLVVSPPASGSSPRTP